MLFQLPRSAWELFVAETALQGSPRFAWELFLRALLVPTRSVGMRRTRSWGRAREERFRKGILAAGREFPGVDLGASSPCRGLDLTERR